MSPCGIVILAAGEARRMGRPKQLLELHGATLLRRCVDTALATGCRPIFVVVGANLERMTPLLDSGAVEIVANPDWQRGIGTSIRAGVAAAKSRCNAVLLLLCDQPLINASDLNGLIQLHENSNKPIVAAAYSGTLGTPALFASSLFDELLELTDSQGGKKIIERHLAAAESMDMPHAAIDIDTEADFNRLIARRPDSIQ